MTVKTELGIIGYVSMVDEIVLEYFNADGEYQPHIGMLNAMRLFYNECVKESKFDEQLAHDNIDAMEMEALVADQEFIEAYNRALIGDGMVRLDFANAYKEAMEIVNVKKTSIGTAMQTIKKAIGGIVEMIAPALTEENIAAIGTIAKDIASGKTGAESIVETYAENLKKVTSSKETK